MMIESEQSVFPSAESYRNFATSPSGKIVGNTDATNVYGKKPLFGKQLGISFQQTEMRKHLAQLQSSLVVRYGQALVEEALTKELKESACTHGLTDHLIEQVFSKIDTKIESNKQEAVKIVSSTSEKVASTQQIVAAIQKQAETLSSIVYQKGVQVASASAAIETIHQRLYEQIHEIDCRSQESIKRAERDVMLLKARTVARGLPLAMINDQIANLILVKKQAEKMASQERTLASIEAIKKAIPYKDALLGYTSIRELEASFCDAEYQVTENLKAALQAAQEVQKAVNNGDLAVAQVASEKVELACSRCDNCNNYLAQLNTVVRKEAQHVESMIAATKVVEKMVLVLVGKIPELAIEIFSATEAVRLIVEVRDRESMVTRLKKSLEESRDAAKKLEPIDSSQVAFIKDKLESGYNDFYTAEVTGDPLIAVGVAQRLAAELNELAQAATAMIPRVEVELAQAPEEFKNSMVAQIAINKNIKNIFARNSYFYRQLAVAKQAEAAQQRLDTISKQLALQETHLVAVHDNNAQYVNEVMQALNRLLSLSQSDAVSFQSLDVLLASEDHMEVTGLNGKIVFKSIQSLQKNNPSITPEERISYKEGIDLVRFLLIKEFGMGSVQRFDFQFNTKIAARNPLNAGELKKFFKTEQIRRDQSTRLAPITSLEGLQSQLEHASAENIIIPHLQEVRAQAMTQLFKSRIVSFDIPLDTELTIVQKEHQEGIVAVRKAIAAASFAKEEERQAALKRFDEKFSILKEAGTPLKVGELKSFIDEEIRIKNDLTQWLQDNFDYYVRTVTVNTIIGRLAWMGITAVPV
ncbi:MAG TPA: hypothetical protein VJK54_06615 [Chthoniobacterales bacterium]|nr:hypothetical protein [Chthoniobacterales bacterium]